MMQFLIPILIAGAVGYFFYRRAMVSKRQRLIDTFRFPKKINQQIRHTYPHLSQADVELVIDGLREYFHICNIAGRQHVSMPSQVVDSAWHEFILFRHAYQLFCNKALGRFLHHTPAEAMQTPVEAQQGIKTAWRISCQREAIDRNKPTSLPSLFAMDAALNIPNGFIYTLDCGGSQQSGYCASHIGCASGCGSGCSDSGGCSSGCGGD